MKHKMSSTGRTGSKLSLSEYNADIKSHPPEINHKDSYDEGQIQEVDIGSVLPNHNTSTPKDARSGSVSVLAVSSLGTPVHARSGSLPDIGRVQPESPIILISEHESSVLNPDDVRVPIVGFEVMEQRAKFTVFKLHVHKSARCSWYVFRRYTDFVELNRKLKTLFPHFRLSLPPRRWFRDNFNRDFLEDRQLGLQAFVNNVIGHTDVCNSLPVKEFFCFEEPPGTHDSLEESRAFCESLEENVYTMKLELQDKTAEIELLKEQVQLYKTQVDTLASTLRAIEEKSKINKSKSSVDPVIIPKLDSPKTNSDNNTEKQDNCNLKP